MQEHDGGIAFTQEEEDSTLQCTHLATPDVGVDMERDMVTVMVIENAQRHFQGSLFGCFEYVPYTALTIDLIIKTINVRLD